MRTNFILLSRWWETFRLLTLSQRGELITMIFHYNMTGEVLSSDDAVISVLFNGPIKTEIDFLNDTYDKKCQALKENGKKGGRPKGSKKQKDNNCDSSIPEKPNGSNENQKKQMVNSETKKTLDMDMDVDMDNAEEEVKEETPAAPLNIDIIVNFYNQNIGCCSDHIYKCLLSAAEDYGIPNTLRACQLACERNKKNVRYVLGVAKGLFNTGEFKPKSEEVPKQESYSSTLAKIAEEKLKEWGTEPSEFEEDFLDGTG